MPFMKPRLDLRTLALTLAFTFSVATGGLGLNALVKAQQEQDRINENLPNQACEVFVVLPCTRVAIDVKDMAVTAALVGLSSAITAILCSVFFIMSLVSPRYTTSTKVPTYEYISLGVISFVTLGALIPMTVFFANHEAGVSVWMGSVQVDPFLVSEMIDFLGEQTQYNQMGFLKPYVIVPWIAWYFTVFAAGSIFIDGRNGRWMRYNNHRSSRADDQENLREGYNDPAPSFIQRISS